MKATSRIRFTPAVSRSCLLRSAGLMWTFVGTVLTTVASYRLYHLDWPQNLLGALTGLALGLLGCRLAFLRTARKNIARILRKPDRNCFFAFQTWRSYLLIFLMMSFGHVLRHSPLPRVIPAVIYLAVGVSLILASSLYFDFTGRRFGRTASSECLKTGPDPLAPPQKP